MGTPPHGLTPVQETAFLTAYARALDSRDPRSILRDTLSDEVVRKLDDVTMPKVPTATRLQVAVRAKGLDRTVRRCLADHPDAVVLDLGAGLDTRVFRVDPPPTVDWYDVDYPEVIAIRRRVLPERPHAHVVGAALTDPHWLDQVPTGRHAVIVAEGVLPFLSHEEIVVLLDLLIGHFPSGDLVFNGYPGFTNWAAKWMLRFVPALRDVALQVRSKAFDDPHEPERWDARLRLVEEVLLVRDPEAAKDIERFPFLLRVTSRPFALTTRLARTGPRILHYRF
jgi:methyltransferase (TIGR00027 family)